MLITLRINCCFKSNTIYIQMHLQKCRKSLIIHEWGSLCIRNVEFLLATAAEHKSICIEHNATFMQHLCTDVLTNS